MNIVEGAIKYPVTTAVAMLFVMLFGTISFFRIPVQLTPTVENPVVVVSTTWPGAAPPEVERQVVQEQEQQLKSLEGLERMSSSSSTGTGVITLTFKVGINADAALINVSNRLQQVPRYPPGVLKPIVRATGSEDEAMAWFAFRKLPGSPETAGISEFRDFVEDVVLPELERVPGVARVGMFGGIVREMQFTVDPVKLAARKITMSEFAAALDRENTNASGGDFEEGKNYFAVRTVGEFSSPEDIENTVIAMRDGVPVFARDVGRAQLGFAKERVTVYLLGERCLAINIVKAPGANLLTVMEQVTQARERLNRLTLAPRGLALEPFVDTTDYMYRAIALVKGSLWEGALLAALVLLLFLRNWSGTAVVVVSIPISIVGSFLLMDLFGRTINVISLAGMAFAVGMVLDNAIVVLENIDRHRQMGKTAALAALHGTREVWGAVLASTLTTVAVFLPIVFIQEEVGQLFRDIALAISCAIVLSMLVAMTVIPSLSAILPGSQTSASRGGKGFRNLFGLVALASSCNRQVARFTHWICRSIVRRMATVALLAIAPVVGSLYLTPKVEYLPASSSNAVFGNMVLPSNHNLTAVDALHSVFEEAAELLRKAEGAEAEQLPGGGIEYTFYVASNSSAFLGATSRDPARATELIPVYRNALATIPGAAGGFSPGSIFQQGGAGNAINLDITGPDFDRLRELAGIVLARVREKLPDAQARPLAGVDNGLPELRITPHRHRSAEFGLNSRDLGLAVDALVDGVKVADYQWEGKRIDLKILSGNGFGSERDSIGQLPIATPNGRLVTLDSVASIEETTGPIQISHRERQRATTVQVIPPLRVPLQDVMETIDREVIEPLAREGILTGAYRIIARGSADKLAQTWQALRLNFLLALVICYLLMCSVFESFVYPFVIMLTVPLAALGGIWGLWVMNLFTYQPLDVLTMLGFFILVGSTVNNAILIIGQALNLIRHEGFEPAAAISEATQSRVRPIFMSVLTSVMGMMPLVLAPGAGSELYRGIGSVVIGGLLLSTVFTLILVPAMLSLLLEVKAVMLRAGAYLRPARPNA